MDEKRRTGPEEHAALSRLERSSMSKPLPLDCRVCPGRYSHAPSTVASLCEVTSVDCTVGVVLEGWCLAHVHLGLLDVAHVAHALEVLPMGRVAAAGKCDDVIDLL